ncbi:MAG: glycosyltransferase family 2 protein [Sulfobacillus sp.]
MIAHDNYTYVKNMIEQLGKFTQRIVVIDNASTYEPLLVLYDKLKTVPHIEIWRMKENHGYRVYMRPEVVDRLPDFFALTDPDLLFNPQMPEDALDLLAQLVRERLLVKAGLALDLENLDEELIAADGRTVRQWEWVFWQNSAGSLRLSSGERVPMYEAPIDTTFAVYHKKLLLDGGFAMEPCVRVAGRFTCRHLPWERQTQVPPYEEAFYHRNAKDKVWWKSTGIALPDSPNPALTSDQQRLGAFLVLNQLIVPGKDSVDYATLDEELRRFFEERHIGPADSLHASVRVVRSENYGNGGFPPWDNPLRIVMAIGKDAALITPPNDRWRIEDFPEDLTKVPTSDGTWNSRLMYLM